MGLCGFCPESIVYVKSIYSKLPMKGGIACILVVSEQVNGWKVYASGISRQGATTKQKENDHEQ